MAIPKISKNDIINALKYIDENGVPTQHSSVKYELVTEDGKKYPPKYVVAVADHLANGADLSTADFSPADANRCLENYGFSIEMKQMETYVLTITADGVVSTDTRFSMDNLSLGDNYKPLDTSFVRANGEVVKRDYRKGENRCSNQTMPRIAFQLYEDQISALSLDDKLSFPVCKYKPDSEMIRGIYNSKDDFKKYRKTIEYMTYHRSDGGKYVIYCWNIFSTIYFVQECLKRFGQQGDSFELKYREKDEKETDPNEEPGTENTDTIQHSGYRNPFSSMLISSKNLIFRGAPGTGKSYLAKEIATDIVSNGYYDDYQLLPEDMKRQIEFVQFHPSYDYTDFIEGLRPKLNEDGSMGFDLQDGIFKKFVERARKNFEDSQKSIEMLENEMSVQESMKEFFDSIQLDVSAFKTINGNDFYITGVDEKHVYIRIPGNATVNTLTLNIAEIRQMLESGQEFEKVKDVTDFFGKTFATQAYSYDFALYNSIKRYKRAVRQARIKMADQKKYIFIIDEINRGEISKIFGELFYSIDPGYRGKSGEISTQYSNLHANPDEKLYIPDNLYIIGTMNDIDRSVDSFDFAMRRRFRFVELKADERLEMLSALGDEDLENEAIRRMAALNKAIALVEDLNENYQIGASYFLKLKELSFDQLWTDYLKPLLQEYIQGMYDEANIMKQFEKAYGYSQNADGVENETAQD